MLRYMARRPPVDDERLREQLRQRLNPIDGANIPADTLALRPSIACGVRKPDRAVLVEDRRAPANRLRNLTHP
jgi:hypothetical protein